MKFKSHFCCQKHFYLLQMADGFFHMKFIIQMVMFVHILRLPKTDSHTSPVLFSHPHHKVAVVLIVI